MLLTPNHYFYKLLEKHQTEIGTLSEIRFLLDFWNRHFAGCKINTFLDVETETEKYYFGTFKIFIYSRGTLEQKYFFNKLKFDKRYFIENVTK